MEENYQTLSWVIFWKDLLLEGSILALLKGKG
jgi:hypothetical protein